MVFGFGLVGLLLFIMAFVKLLPFVLTAGILTGIAFAIIYSIPYGLVGQYHSAFKVGYIALKYLQPNDFLMKWRCTNVNAICMILIN